MLNDKSLVEGGAEMSSLKLQAAVRRKIEAAFPQEVRTRLPCWGWWSASSTCH